MASRNVTACGRETNPGRDHDDVAQVSDLVGELDQLRLRAQVGRVLYVAAFPLVFRQRLVVTRFENDNPGSSAR